LTSHHDQLQSLLRRFEELNEPDPGGYRWSHHHDGGEHQIHLIFGSMTHGDEVGSLPGVVRALEQLQEGSLRFGGRLTFFIGNPEAGLERKRFLEQDLNRMFMERDEDAHEVRRARQLMPILDGADLLVDFHQTILATHRPFYICPWHRVGWLWARAVGGAEHWVTRPPNESFASGLVCADEYVRVQGRAGLTLELGEQGFFPEAAELALRTIRRALVIGDQLSAQPTALEEAAMKMPELSFLETVHREKFVNPQMALRDGMINFEPVSEGDLLSDEGRPELRAPSGGAVLFPKYPPRDQQGNATEPRPGELYRIVKALDGHPLDLWEEA